MRPRKPPPEPTRASLQEAALAHVARFGTTEANLLRVLGRRIARWQAAVEAPPEAAATARAVAREVVRRLVEAGAVNDAAFAEGRARALARSGRSARAIGAHLAAKGVKPGTAAPETARDLPAAAILARKRRLGPWRRGEATPEVRRREFGAFARAGFSADVARQVLAMSAEEGEALILAFRREV